MTSYQFYTTDVFTTERFGGNPLAVFPKANGLDDATMQRIAREFNLSETIFMFPTEREDCTVKVRIFTPYFELPFAGHPTVGGAFVMATIGDVPLTGRVTEIAFDEGVGRVPITIYADDNGAVTKAVLSAAVVPEVMGGAPSADLLADVLTLQPGDVLSEAFSPQIIKSGTPRLFAPVKNREVLGSIQIDVAKWRKQLPGTRSVYAFCTDPEGAESDLRGRMFVVSDTGGMYEDPATGSAVTGLAAYLVKQSGQIDGTLRWVMEQGFEMGRPSYLEIEAEVAGGVCQAVRVGGSSVMVSSGEFLV